MDPIILPRISDQKPLVSVVSITYNHEPYIRDCLEGFLMQKTDFPVEIIIHDDASTDHTADIIREYYEKRPDLFHVIIERVNQYSQHKQILIPLYKQAKGKYIALCEGDDYWTDPLKLQKQFDFMENNKEYSAVVHRYDVINKTGTRQNIKTFGYYEEEQSGRFALKDFEKTVGLPSQLATLFFKSTVIKDELLKSFLEKCKLNGDTKLFFLILLTGDIYRMKDTMSVYRFVQEQGGNSWTSRMANHYEPYKKWKDYKELESFAKDKGKTIDVRERKLLLAGEFLYVLKNNCCWRNFLNTLLYLVQQKGAIKKLSMIAKNKMRKTWKKKDCI